MQNLVFLILPYRDDYFIEKYGNAVRDLQIVDCLAHDKSVDHIVFLNRPASIAELVLCKKRPKRSYTRGKILFKHSVSLDILGPLKKRLWAVDCYKKLIFKEFENIIESWPSHKIVVLDFHPFATFPANLKRSCFYWYDMIDNFAKHNRFSTEEIAAVKCKYSSLVDADVVTAVNPKALAELPNSTVGSVLPNGIYDPFERQNLGSVEFSAKEYTFGFIGFITNKFDVEFVFELLDRRDDFKLIIYGDFYDEDVKKVLLSHQKIAYGGIFRVDDVRKKCESFRFGLIPYRRQLSHDESPLKLYSYLVNGVPCISTVEYEIRESVVLYCDETDIGSVVSFVDDFESMEASNISNMCEESVREEYYIGARLNKFMVSALSD